MSIFWFIVGPLTLWRIIAWLRRRQQPGWRQMMGDPLSLRRPRLHHQLGGRKRRRIAREQVRDLAGALAAAVHDPVVHLSACYGPAALADHPGRACVWDRARVSGPGRGNEPPLVGPRQPVLRLWSSRPGE